MLYKLKNNKTHNNYKIFLKIKYKDFFTTFYLINL